jgi:hypothetical protein
MRGAPYSAAASLNTCVRQHTSAYVSIRQHTPYSAAASLNTCVRHTSVYVSIRQHTSAYVSIRQHTSAYEYPIAPLVESNEASVAALVAPVCFIHPVRIRTFVPGKQVNRAPALSTHSQNSYFCTSKASKSRTCFVDPVIFMPAVCRIGECGGACTLPPQPHTR